VSLTSDKMFAILPWRALLLLMVYICS